MGKVISTQIGIAAIGSLFLSVIGGGLVGFVVVAVLIFGFLQYFTKPLGMILGKL